MIAEVGKSRYSIRWRHDVEGRYTSCMVEKLGELGYRMFIGEAAAICSVKDQFCKETGRRVSLARAIKGFEREKRAQIWAEYWRQKTHEA
jgi:hypothetical protein